MIERIRELLADGASSIPDSLKERIKKYLNQDALLEAARRNDLLERVAKALKSEFERTPFQGTNRIAEYMQMVGCENVFHEVAIRAGMNEDTLKQDLDRFTQRRHDISHNGDYDLSQRPPKENSILKGDAEACIKLVTTIAKQISEWKVEK